MHTLKPVDLFVPSLTMTMTDDPDQGYFLFYTYTDHYPERRGRPPDPLTVCSGCSLDRANMPFLAEVRSQ